MGASLIAFFLFESMLLCILAVVSAAAHDVFLPELLGNHPVGTISFELINTASSPPRDLMLFAYYPITYASSQQYPLARDFSPVVGEWLDAYENFTGSARVVTRAHQSAPISSSSQFPVLLFGTGYGEPIHLSGTQTMSNLASQGYIVIGVEHANDTQVIEYPDGRVVYFPVNENITDADELIPFVDNRVSDMRFIASQLRNISVVQNIPGLRGGLEFENLGILGFSLGGSSAASAMLADPIFSCGSNMDGKFVGNITKLGLDRPFLLMNSMTHTWTTDDTWPTFYQNLRGYRKDAQVLRTRHKSYSDWLLLKNLLVKNDTDPANADLLPGTRLAEIENAYLTSFFDMCFRNGTGSLLEGNSTRFPEVQLLS